MPKVCPRAARNGDGRAGRWHQVVTPGRAVCSALVLAWLGSLGIARAQTVADKDASPVAPAPADNPPIALPSPGASPEKVEDAKSTAKAAKLTPLVPSPRNPLRPAFQLYAEIDLPILGIGLVFESARLFRPQSQKAFCAPLCPTSDLNVLDRTTAGYWSPGWQTASDYGLYAIGLGAATLLFVDEGLWPGLNDAVVIAESGLAATAAASVMTLAAGRPRPFLYGTKAPLSERNGADAGLSFLSSHAAVSFAVATSTLVAMRRLHPHSRANWIVLGVGGAIASFVATARVLGGMHFISDVVGGAVVGSSLGVIIPSLHGSPVSLVPVAGDGGQRGMAVNVRF
jgi:membrane-associated phospholipid phosphatase